ncbi:MAG: HipA N-terminal domain-containing protein [Nannocystis sp.]|nr:HipA N-terminal domain-containing protein [Nannocystis sp.]
MLQELRGGYTSFTYDRAYLERSDALGISPTLPLQAEPYTSRGLHSFFAGLLPEGWLLGLTRERHQLAVDDLVGALLATGHDMVGALEILPWMTTPRRREGYDVGLPYLPRGPRGRRARPFAVPRRVPTAPLRGRRACPRSTSMSAPSPPGSRTRRARCRCRGCSLRR